MLRHYRYARWIDWETMEVITTAEMEERDERGEIIEVSPLTKETLRDYVHLLINDTDLSEDDLPYIKDLAGLDGLTDEDVEFMQGYAAEVLKSGDIKPRNWIEQAAGKRAWWQPIFSGCRGGRKCWVIKWEDGTEQEYYIDWNNQTIEEV